jgi:hypothetical protein
MVMEGRLEWLRRIREERSGRGARAGISVSAVIEVKRGRPRLQEAGGTLAARRPWEELGMPRRTWYRRRREGKE